MALGAGARKRRGAASIIDGLGRGEPTYGRDNPEVAAETRRRLLLDEAILRKLGPLRAMSFRGVSALGSDIYIAHFANGSASGRSLWPERARSAKSHLVRNTRTIPIGRAERKAVSGAYVEGSRSARHVNTDGSFVSAQRLRDPPYMLRTVALRSVVLGRTLPRRS